MIKFTVDATGAILEYEPEFRSGEWITSELESAGEVTLSRVFTVTRSDLMVDLVQDPEEYEPGEPSFSFRFSTLAEGYHRIPGRVLGLSADVLIEAGIRLERKLFAAERNVSIFRRIAGVTGEGREIVIGGERDDAIPLPAFEDLLRRFPNSGELDRYANARVASVIGDYLDGMRDHRQAYETYLNRKAMGRTTAISPESLLQGEIDKYILIRDTVEQWLKHAGARPERDWQRMIVEFILLIFPKYVAVLENVKIEDHYSRPGSTTNRFIDLALVDASGNVDVIEVKRPFDDALLSRGRYRDNFVPTKELSGTIMQAEKYLFHLSKWGVAGERKLTDRYRALLPNAMPIRITNPKALLILGRDRRPDGSDALDATQAFDLEVIKRKYANMMDILTYDDLLRRLDNIIASLRDRVAMRGL